LPSRESSSTEGGPNEMSTGGPSQVVKRTLAQVCTLPESATYAEIEDAVLKCFTIALEHAGLKDSIEYVGGQRRDTLRIVQ
jgi:hypothetical protein